MFILSFPSDSFFMVRHAMRKIIYGGAIIVLILALVYHFALLKAFNFFVLKDAASEFVAGGISYGADSRQRLDIYRPKQTSRNLPVLVFVHGGSWKDGDGRDYGFVGRAFAARGYLTLVISYRLVPQNIYPAFVEDVAAAVAWSNTHATEYGGDGSSVYLVGHSAGGYNIAMAVLDLHYLRDAGADAKSVKGLALLAAPLDFLPLDTEVTLETFSHVSDLGATQPVNFARAGAPPILLLHGLDDTTVFPRNSRALLKRLQNAGAIAKLIEYPGVSHVRIVGAISRLFRSSAPVVDDVVSFFGEHP
jgi:acetyl esterase/lipase